MQQVILHETVAVECGHQVEGLISTCIEMRLCVPSRHLFLHLPVRKGWKIAERGHMLASHSSVGNPGGFSQSAENNSVILGDGEFAIAGRLDHRSSSSTRRRLSLDRRKLDAEREVVE